MANYTREIAHMLDRLNTKTLSQDKEGFYKNHLKANINLLEMLIIKQIGEHGDIRLNQLIKVMEVDRNLVTTTLKRLIGLKLLQKKPDGTDGRGQIVSMTLLGSELYQDLLKQQQLELDFILNDVTINEEKTILKFISKMVQVHTDKYEIK